MEMHTQDYLKKTLLETQERVRDFTTYSDRIQDRELQHFFREYAQAEGEQARRIQVYLDSKR